jgi:hypothetical protein
LSGPNGAGGVLVGPGQADLPERAQPQASENSGHLTPGALVLASVGSAEGWWESVIVEISEDLLTLKWRDWPDEPTFVRRTSQIALLHPSHPDWIYSESFVCYVNLSRYNRCLHALDVSRGVTFLTCRCRPNKHYQLVVEAVMGDINRTHNSTAKREHRSAKTLSSAACWKQLLTSFGPFVPLLIAVVLGIVTTAGAITAAKNVRATAYGFQAGGHIEYLGAPSLREVLW